MTQDEIVLPFKMKQFCITTVTSDTKINEDHDLYFVDASKNDVTLFLPLFNQVRFDGLTVIIKRIDDSTHKVNVLPSNSPFGNTIDGQPGYSIGSHKCIILTAKANGANSNWIALGNVL